MSNEQENIRNDHTDMKKEQMNLLEIENIRVKRKN